jgi:small subunit ribosomal protein S4
MKIGPKYKIARRLGAPIFEKTQNQKFALSEERKQKSKRPRQKTDYGLQLTEKQKARMFYGITEKQFKNYVNKSLSQKGVVPSAELLANLESRLDNTVWRIGLASTHGAARQMVSHGHICVNGKKVRIPSMHLNMGDVISIREGSKKSPLFGGILEKGPEKEIPAWIGFDNTKKEATVKSKPTVGENELMFSLGQVIEFYQR